MTIFEDDLWTIVQDRLYKSVPAKFDKSCERLFNGGRLVIPLCHSFIIIFAVYDPQSVGESDNLCFHLKLNCRQLDLVGWHAAAVSHDDDDDE